MSTRANVIIKDKYDKLWFYRHSDGYPEGALPTLKKFMKWVKDGKIRDNVSQSSGWLVILGAEEYKGAHIIRKEKIYEDLTPEQEEEYKDKISSIPLDWKVGAYEPTEGQHGDIEFLYTLDLEKKIILVDSLDDKEPEIINI